MIRKPGAFVLALLVLFPAVAGAQGRSFAPNDAELAMLPEYCHARIRGSDDEKRYWSRRMGQGQFVHVHHYCFALNFVFRYQTTFGDRSRQQLMLQRALSNFDYVLQRWPESFSLVPEARVQKGRLLLSAGRAAEAVREFEQAIAVAPQYPYGYIYLSRHYRENGEPDRAVEVLEEGLRHAPESKPLQDQIAGLQGE